jgi:putative transposase
VGNCLALGVGNYLTFDTYYRWRKGYGGLKVSQAKRLKDLERENARLRRAVSDLTLDKLILQEADWKLLKPLTLPQVCGGSL